ncbi:hypothetical protein BVX94_02860 [bacterium B17]|nr:hypothetical protein BVX94_02860 [bacterium B17]
MAVESVSSPVASRVERTPPYSEEAEQGVLGSILIDSTRVMDICLERQIEPESFYVPANRTIYASLMEMMTRGVVCDMVTVVDHLKSTGKLDSVGGPIYIERLIDATPTAAHAEYYIDIVRQKHLLRCIIDCAREAERECYSTDDKADVVLSKTEQSFLDITERQHGFMMPWNTAVKETMQHVENIYNGSATLGGIPTGFQNLDEKALGLRPSEMIVLAARPSMGKTSLAMNIAENIALGRGNVKDAMSVGIFSLEMAQEALVLRMLCSTAEVSSSKLTKGYVDQNAHRRLIQAASDLSKAPIYLDDTGGLDIHNSTAFTRQH